jgi:hypothetical protein
MQIHEITQPVLKEGLFDAFRQPSAVAADAASKLTAQGYGPTYKAPSDSWEDKYAKILQDPAIKQYVKGLAQGWAVQSANLAKQPATPKSSTPAARANPGQMSAAVAASKAGKDMQKMFGQPRGGIQNMQSDLEEAPQEYTTPGGIVVPGGTKTDKSTTTTQPAAPQSVTPKPATDPIASTFVAWSDGQLASQDPVTRQPITMDDVRAKFPDLNDRLNKFLGQIVKTQGTAQQVAAVEEYAKLAVSGIQALAQTSRNRAPQQRTTDLGVSPQQLAGLRSLGQTPAGKDLLIKQLGLGP